MEVGERVAEVRLAPLRSEEAVWGKVIYIEAKHAPLLTQLQLKSNEFNHKICSTLAMSTAKDSGKVGILKSQLATKFTRLNQHRAVF